MFLVLQNISSKNIQIFFFWGHGKRRKKEWEKIKNKIYRRRKKNSHKKIVEKKGVYIDEEKRVWKERKFD